MTQGHKYTDKVWKNYASTLGLCIFHKIHLFQTWPLIRRCMLNTNITHQFGTYIQFRYFGIKYKNSFFPYFSVLWSKQQNSLICEPDTDVFKTYLKEIYKPKKQRHYNYGNKLADSLLCRLRVGCSALKSHGFAINLSRLIFLMHIISHHTLSFLSDFLYPFIMLLYNPS